MAHIIREKKVTVSLVSEMMEGMREIEKRDLHRNYFTLQEVEEYLMNRGIKYDIYELGDAVTHLCQSGINNIALEKHSSHYDVKLMNNKKL